MRGGPRDEEKRKREGLYEGGREIEMAERGGLVTGTTIGHK